MLHGYGAKIDAFHFCPHHPEAELAAFRIECSCRKPRAGMLVRAAAELRLDLRSSWMIGDRVTDLEAGAAVGCRTVLVRTGYGAGYAHPRDTYDDEAPDLAGAAALILERDAS